MEQRAAQAVPDFPRARPLAVAANDLACERGGRLIFAGVTFRLEPGQLLAVTGPNGAGKSSLLRVLAGLVRPAAGKLRLDGAEEGWGAVHYLGHADALKPALTLRETLAFWASLFGRDGGIAPAGAATFCGVGSVLDVRAGVLSAGQRRRAGFARLLIAPRPLWLLDEPTASLDRAGVALLGALIAAHRASGGLVIAATHEILPATADATLAIGAAA